MSQPVRIPTMLETIACGIAKVVATSSLAIGEYVIK
jgi:hypothetical protein